MVHLAGLENSIVLNTVSFDMRLTEYKVAVYGQAVG